MPDIVVSSFTSFLTNTPSAKNIIAIEDNELLIIAKEELEAHSIEIPKLQIWRILYPHTNAVFTNCPC